MDPMDAQAFTGQFTPQELEEQRRRANAMRGQQMIGALASTSQIPGAAQQGQLAQRVGAEGLKQAQSANMAELERRDTAQRSALKRAVEAELEATRSSESERDRDYLTVINPQSGERDTIRKGDDVPEGMVLASDYADLLDSQGTGKGNKKLTQAQMTALYHAENMGAGLAEAQKLLDGEYDPGSIRGFFDQAFKDNSLTNWMVSQKGQKFNSAAGTIREAALRTSTGAAAPESEQKDYMMTLIPRAGDTDDTIRWKMDKLYAIQQNIARLGGETDEEANEAFLRAVEEAGMDEIPGNEGGGGETANPDDARRKRLEELRAKRAAGG